MVAVGTFLTHKIMITYAVDFESYYDKDCSISVYGPRGYFAHPKFNAYMVSVVGCDGYEWCGDPTKFNWQLLEGHLVLSHNASFDESLYLYGVEQGWWASVNYAEWHCTADLAAFLGKPRALKNAVKEVFGVELSKETRDNMKGLNWEIMEPDFKAEVTAYALDDSRWCLRLWQELGSQWPEYERYYSAHTRKICRRGIPVDEMLIEKNAGTLRVALFEAQQAIPWRDSGALLSRTEANKACRAAGIIPPKSWAMGDEECEAWLDQHAETFPWVYAVRSYRRINALLKKVESFEKGTFNNRYYGGLMYCGAHTKRFSGSGGNLNLQNLPRKEMFGVDLRAQIVAPEGSSFVVVDLSQIEVRTLCWLAKDWDTLKEIRGTDDMYEAFAIRFGLWTKEQGSMKASNPGLRQTVKGMVLGCGYGASAKKYAMIMKCSLEEATKSVRLYQTKMNKVVELWRKFEREIKMSSKSGEYRVELPSGNAMHYKSVSKTADALVCTMVRNGRPVLVRPWHGMLTENCLIGETNILSKQRGWVQIQDVRLDDKLWDGLDFVEHKGLINSGIQEVIQCHGVTCTPEHQFLLEDNWTSAEKARHLKLSLVRLPHGVNKQSKGLCRNKVWYVLGTKTYWETQTKHYLGASMRLWQKSESFIRRTCNWEVLLKNLSTAFFQNFGTKVYAQKKQTQTFFSVAFNERPLSANNSSSLEQLWGSWNYSMPRMARFISGILGSNVFNMVGGPLPRPHRQQRGLLFRKLSMGNLSGKYAEHSTLTNSQLGIGPKRQKWNCTINAFIQNKCWSVFRNSKHTETESFKQVFDIRDCGPRNRFVVRGSQGQLLIAHNCSQSLARDIFCYHLRQIEEAGHKIILHVHDEVVIECADADAQSTLTNVVALMRTPPPWIPDIPLDAEGHTVKVYSK